MGKILDSSEMLSPDMQKFIVNEFACMLHGLQKGHYFRVGLALNPTEHLLANVRLLSREPECVQLEISHGFLRYIYEVCYIVLSDNEVLKDTGTSDHTIRIPSTNPLTWIILDDYLHNTDLPEFDEERIMLHSYVIKFCLRFLLFHEAMHVLNGHCGYHLANYKKSLLGQITDILTNLDIQTLEFDADCCAASGFFMHVLNEKASLPGGIESDEMKLYCFWLAVSCLLYGLPGQILKGENLLQSDHPNASMRMRLMGAAIFTLISIKYQDKQQSFLLAIKSQLKDFSRLIDNEIFSSLAINDFQLTYDQAGTEHIKRIEANWPKWRNILKPFAYRPLN